MAARKTTASAAPAVSTRPLLVGSLDSGTCRAVMTSTKTDNGMLMKKTHRHEPTANR